MNERALIYIPSKKIVDFVTDNPINWMDGDKELAKRGGAGDKAGVTPTPAVGEFLNLLVAKRGLFTQSNYVIHCWKVWRYWVLGLPVEQRTGVEAKLYRNFYSSMIDSLHVWAMLCESGEFDTCFMSSTEDAIGKTDLILIKGGVRTKVALIGPTEKASTDHAYKLEHRGDGTDDCVKIKLPYSYPRNPGNKRWFRESDIMEAVLPVLHGGKQ